MSGTHSWFSSYLPLNDEARKWEIHCDNVGFTRVEPHAHYPPVPQAHPHEFADSVTTGRVLDVFQLVYITRGRGSFWSQPSGELRVLPGTVFLVFPGVEHRYRPDAETGWYEQWIGFAGPHAHRLRENGILEEARPLFPVGIQDDLTRIFESAFALCHDQLPGFQIRLGALVLQLVATVHSHHRYARQSLASEQIVAMAREEMRAKLETGISVEAIARRCGVSYNGLLRYFREYTGLTPYQYFLQLRVQRAKELLASTRLQVKEVAARLNFDNQYYFARLFRQKAGVPPTVWRRQMRDSTR